MNKRLLWTSLTMCLACEDLRDPREPADLPETAGKRADAAPSGAAGSSGDGGRAGSSFAAKGGGTHADGGALAGQTAGSGGRDAPRDAAVGGSGGSTASESALPFTARNLPVGMALRAPGDLVLNSAGCNNLVELDTGTGTLRGCDGQQDQLQFSFQAITQPDASLGPLQAALFVTRRFVVETGIRVRAVGNRPLIVVATEEASIQGQLEAAATFDQPGAGGYGPGVDGQNGLGPGGGGRPQVHSAAAGAGFCGKGGDGGASEEGVVAQGGKPYGRPENSPLIGGSSGAKGTYVASAGGGAIQISAGKRIEVSAPGVIHVGGGGAGWASGGGASGGAILLEAPSVRVHGHLAANGGSGSAPGDTDAAAGANGSTDDQPALGGRASDSLRAGNGSAAAMIHGETGASRPSGQTGSGGGGGGAAGRIRINVAAGTKPELDGALISPSTSTECFSTGELE